LLCSSQSVGQLLLRRSLVVLSLSQVSRARHLTKNFRFLPACPFHNSRSSVSGDGADSSPVSAQVSAFRTSSTGRTRASRGKILSKAKRCSSASWPEQAS